MGNKDLGLSWIGSFLPCDRKEHRKWAEVEVLALDLTNGDEEHHLWLLEVIKFRTRKSLISKDAFLKEYVGVG